jgi:hypothetical protein
MEIFKEGKPDILFDTHIRKKGDASWARLKRPARIAAEEMHVMPAMSQRLPPFCPTT